MNSLIIYFSKFGNTRQVAEVIAKEFTTAGEARVVGLDACAPSYLEGIDLVVVGSPTHRMKLPEVVRTTLKSLPRGTLRGKRVAAFDTSYKMSWWLAFFTAARKLDRRLRRLGGKRVIKPETFYVTAREGPLYEGEIERAKEWAQTLASG
jgi:flavodoxin